MLIWRNNLPNPQLGIGSKKWSESDGFAIRVNITKYIEKYKMEPPRLVRSPPKAFYEVQEQFMQRGFLEMKDLIQNKAQEHIRTKKRELYHKVECDIDLEKVDLEPITLFTISGKKIASFSDIDSNCKIIVISLDGTFKGLINTLKPDDQVKQRIVKEKQTRNSYKIIQDEFSQKVFNVNKLQEASESSPVNIKTPNIQKNGLEVKPHHYPMINDQYRNKFRSKTKYYKGFNPAFFGGLKSRDRSLNKAKIQGQSKPHTLQLMNRQISKISENESQLKNNELFKDYANKKSIHEVTLEMMDNLEKNINDTIDQYISNLKGV